jgi:Domain of unknown function (DUF4112)
MRSGSLRGDDIPAAAGPDRMRALAELETLARLLDARYRIPFTPIRFGADAILGLIPGIGDAAAALPALYLVWRAHALGMPRGMILRMLANVGLDTLVGSVPVAGTVFDVYFKASRRNTALLRRHIEGEARRPGS